MIKLSRVTYKIKTHLKERLIMSNVLFTSTATTIGGRNGHVKSASGAVDMDLAMPGTPRAKELPHAVNPELLFASGYSACFGGAVELAARQEKVKLDSEIEVTGNVSLLKDEEFEGQFKIGVVLHVKGKGMEKSVLENIVHKAHEFCPYSKATRGNIDVALEIEV